MTSITSKLTNKNTRFMKNFIISVKSNRKLLIFISAMHILGLPLTASLAVTTSALSDSRYDSTIEAFALISIFCFAAAILSGIFIPIINFSYLHKKSQVDMVYSLPITRRTKFLSDYSAGLAVYALPYIAACVIGDIILCTGTLCVPAMAENLTYTSAKGMFQLLFQGEFAGLLIMIMTYTLTVLVTCCCGTLFESILNIFMINALIPGAIIVAAAMLFSGLYGVHVTSTAMPIFSCTSPLGACFGMIEKIDDSEGAIDAVFFAKWTLSFIIATAVYFTISLFLYTKRKAEDVSKPYVYKIFYYITISVITAAISLLPRYEESTLFPVILFSLIVYLIFETVTNRGFKKIHLSLIRYAATVAAIAVVSAAAIATHGFGAEGKVYPLSLIKSVETTYSGIDDLMEVNFNINYINHNPFYLDSNMKYTDKEIIKRVLEVQKDAINTYRSGEYDTYKNFDGVYYIGSDYLDDYGNPTDTDTFEYPYCIVKFKFHLKTGGTAVREYILSMEQLKKLFILDTTEEMADYRANNFLECMTWLEYDHEGEQYNRYTMNYSRYRMNYRTSDRELSELNLTKEEAEELARCYRNDYAAASEEDFLTSGAVLYVDGVRPIRDCFTQTINYLESKGVMCGKYTNSPVVGRLYPPEGYKSFGRDNITATFGRYYIDRSKSKTINSAKTNELMQYASSCCYRESPCYVIELMDCIYAIPPEYTSIAEEIYNDSKSSSDSRYTFEDFRLDYTNCGSIYDYIQKVMHGDDSCYGELQSIENYLSIAEEYVHDRDFTEDPDNLPYFLFRTFLGFSSAEDYIGYMREMQLPMYFEGTDESVRGLQDRELDEDTVKLLYDKYREMFPALSGMNFSFTN